MDAAVRQRESPPLPSLPPSSLSLFLRCLYLSFNTGKLLKVFLFFFFLFIVNSLCTLRRALSPLQEKGEGVWFVSDLHAEFSCKT